MSADLELRCQETVVRRGKGTIQLCVGCGCFELEYGNFAVTLDARGLATFCRLAHEGYLGTEKDWYDGDTLHLKLSNAGFRLVIPGAEVEDLWLLLRDGIRCLVPQADRLMASRSDIVSRDPEQNPLIH